MLHAPPFAFLLMVMLASVPAWFCWLLADGAQRGVIRFHPRIVSGVRAVYMALVAAPFAFVLTFGLFVLRATLAEGHWPRHEGVSAETFPDLVSPSPHPMSMPIHAWTVLVLSVIAAASLVGVPALWPILRVTRSEPATRILRWFLPGMLVVALLWMSNPGSILQWFFLNAQEWID